MRTRFGARGWMAALRPAALWLPALLLLAPGASLAQDSGFGLGIIAGEPTGLSAKIWLSQRSALDLAAAWSFQDETALHLHADYVAHFFDLIKVSKGKLPLYAGVGGRVKFGEHDEFVGIRVPVGLAYLFAGVPVDAFVEIVPLLELTPETELRLNAAIGARYFFGSGKSGSAP